MGPGKTFVYGKRKPFEVGVVREYECLHAGPDLSPEALGAFWSLSGGFTWKSAVDREVLDPVVATMVLTDPPRLLVCRVLDDGADNMGRSHLVRVEGVELPPGPGGEEMAAVLADPRGWSVGAPSFSVEVRPGSSGPLVAMGALSGHLPGGWVIKPGDYWFKGGSLTPPRGNFPAPPGARKSVGPNSYPWPADLPVPGPPGTTSRRDHTKGGLLRAGLTWLLLASSLMTAGLCLFCWKKVAEGQAILAIKESQLEKKEKELAEEKGKVLSLYKENAEQVVKIADKDGEINTLKAANQRLAPLARRVGELEEENKDLRRESRTPEGHRKTIDDLRKKMADSSRKNAERWGQFKSKLDALVQEASQILKDPGETSGTGAPKGESAGPQEGGPAPLGRDNPPAGGPGPVPPANKPPGRR